jgi:hypothetical protein
VTKPVIYLAGPMTGINHFNYELFLDIGSSLESIFDVRNPAGKDIDGGFKPWEWDGMEGLERTGFDLEAALRWDLSQVRIADLVIVLPAPHSEWVSKGLNLELKCAKRHGVPTYELSWADIHVAHSDNGKGVGYALRDETRRELKELAPKLLRNPLRVDGGEPVVNGVIEELLNEVNLKPGEYVVSKADYEKIAKPALDALNKAQSANPWTGDKGEVRSVSSTGGEKGVKLARYDLIPVDALRQIAEHYGRGAEKYDDNQWRKGYEWSKSFAALIRHANQFWGGEDYDEETGSNHMAAVAWHALTLLTFFEEHPDFDDRYVSNGAES